MVFLNRNTFTGNLATDAPLFDALLDLIRAEKIDKLAVFPEHTAQLYALLGQLKGDKAKWFRRAHLRRPFAYSGHDKTRTPVYARYQNHRYVISPGGQPAESFGWASLLAGVSVGILNPAYGSKLSYFVDETDGQGQRTMPMIQSLMLDKAKHFREPEYLRWRFVEEFKNDLGACSDEYVTFPATLSHIHCSPRKSAYKRYCAESLWSVEPWVNATSSGDQAYFMPGIGYASTEYKYLVYLVLKAAYQKQVYLQSDQDGFIVDVNTNIGASGGSVTSKVMIRVTPQNAIHIRPTEKPAAAVLSDRYVYGKIDLGLQAVREK